MSISDVSDGACDFNILIIVNMDELKILNYGTNIAYQLAIKYVIKTYIVL